LVSNETVIQQIGVGSFLLCWFLCLLPPFGVFGLGHTFHSNAR
jgi:hypothetical protein